MTTGTTAVEIHVEAESPAERRREPVTCGLPWPRGAVPADARLAMTDGAGRPVPLQVRTLDRWPDGSVRWALLDWQATVQGRASFFVQVSSDDSAAETAGLTVTELNPDHTENVATLERFASDLSDCLSRAPSIRGPASGPPATGAEPRP